MTQDATNGGSGANRGQDGPPKLVPLPPDWPGSPLPLMPGDLTKYVPQGLGFAQPMIVRPWDDPLKVLTGPSYYGFDPPESDPIRSAPSQEPTGGVIYFDDAVSQEAVQAVLDVMGVHGLSRDFAVFAADSSDTPQDRFLTQVRIVSKPALHHLFGAGEHAEKLPGQPLTIGEYIAQFLAEQRSRWNDPRYAFSDSLSGKLGGDGDWAKESLAFGFLVENSYWAVYRLWSRPWLVTK